MARWVFLACVGLVVAAVMCITPADSVTVNDAVDRVNQGTSALRRAARRHKRVRAVALTETKAAAAKVTTQATTEFDGFEHWTAGDAAWTAALKPSLYSYERSQAIVSELHPTSTRLTFSQGAPTPKQVIDPTTALEIVPIPADQQPPASQIIRAAVAPSSGDEKGTPASDGAADIDSKYGPVPTDYWGNVKTNTDTVHINPRMKPRPTGKLRAASTLPGFDSTYKFPLLGPMCRWSGSQLRRRLSETMFKAQAPFDTEAYGQWLLPALEIITKQYEQTESEVKMDSYNQGITTEMAVSGATATEKKTVADRIKKQARDYAFDLWAADSKALNTARSEWKKLVAANRGTGSAAQPKSGSQFSLANALRGTTLSFGQITAIAGDFVANPDQPICKASVAAPACPSAHELTREQVLESADVFLQTYATLCDVPRTTLDLLVGVITDEKLAIRENEEKYEGWKPPAQRPDQPKQAVPENPYHSRGSSAIGTNLGLAHEFALDYATSEEARTKTLAQVRKHGTSKANGNSVTKAWAAIKNPNKYFRNAATNYDHFGNCAIRAYSAGHFIAQSLAVLASVYRDRVKHDAEYNMPESNMQSHWDHAIMLLDEAYKMEAFAQHFYSDQFAAGHLRTPRSEVQFAIQEMSPWITPLVLKGPMVHAGLTKLMHDEDNRLGLKVVNDNGDRWAMYGDDFYFDEKNAQNRKIMHLGLKASIDEVTSAFENGKLMAAIAPKYAVGALQAARALHYLPRIDPTWTENEPGFWGCATAEQLAKATAPAPAKPAAATPAAASSGAVVADEKKAVGPSPPVEEERKRDDDELCASILYPHRKKAEFSKLPPLPGRPPLLRVLPDGRIGIRGGYKTIPGTFDRAVPFTFWNDRASYIPLKKKNVEDILKLGLELLTPDPAERAEDNRRRHVLPDYRGELKDVDSIDPASGSVAFPFGVLGTGSQPAAASATPATPATAQSGSGGSLSPAASGLGLLPALAPLNQFECVSCSRLVTGGFHCQDCNYQSRDFTLRERKDSADRKDGDSPKPKHWKVTKPTIAALPPASSGDAAEAPSTASMGVPVAAVPVELTIGSHHHMPLKRTYRPIRVPVETLQIPPSLASALPKATAAVAAGAEPESVATVSVVVGTPATAAAAAAAEEPKPDNKSFYMY